MLRPLLLSAIVLLGTGASAADDPAAAIDQFFRAYADGAELAPYWPDAGRETFENARRLLLRSRCLELEHVRIDDLVVSGDSATARVTLLLTKRERATGRAWGPRPIDYDVSLVRTRNGWRIRNVEPMAEKFAELLVKAADADVRRAIFDAAPQAFSVDVGRVLIARAFAATYVPDAQEAMRLGTIAEEIAAQIGDAGGMSLVRSLRSHLERGEGRWEEARTIGIQALDLARRADDPDAIARALIVIGRSHDNEPAGEIRPVFFREALALESRVEDLALMVRAANGLEHEHGRRNDYIALRRAIDEELRLATLADDAIGKAAATLNLGVLYSNLNDLDTCVQYASEAAELYRDLSPGRFHISSMLVEALCRQTRGELSAARTLIDRSLEAARYWKDKISEANSMSILAEHHFVSGAYSSAQEAASASIRLFKNINVHVGSEQVILARAYLGQRRYGDALAATREYHRDAIATGVATEVQVLALDAKAHRGLRDRKAALADVDAAMDLIDRAREQFVGDEQQRAQAFSAIAEAYVEAVDLYVELGRTREALAYAEQAKGRILLQAMRHGGRPSKSMTSEEERSELRLESQIASLNRRLAHAAGSSDTIGIEKELKRARTEYASFQSSLYSRQPALKTQRGDIAVASPEEMIAALPDRGVFLEYVVADERTHIFVVTAKRGRADVRVRTVPVTRRALEQKVKRYVARLSKRSISHRRAARELDALLLAPIDDVLRHARIIGIVADGPLWQLPFEALVDASGRHRIETHTIFYAPSVSVFLEMRSPVAVPSRVASAPTILAVGDPLISTSARSTVAAVYRNTDLSPLPDARTEVEKLRTIYGRNAAVVYVGADATESRVKSEMRDHAILHFATHGILDDASPMHSRLLLAEGRDDSGSNADGFLEAWELMKLDLEADLVVMSSCDSARGGVSAGEGLIGMTWAVFVAGAQSTVASLWKVATTSTGTLMIDFHRQLHAGPRGPVAKAEALRSAKLRLLRDPAHRHPFFWAPFIVIGDPGPTQSLPRGSP